MVISDKIKHKHEFLLMYPSYKESIALCLGSYQHYPWCDISDEKYAIKYTAEPALKRVSYFPDMNELYNALTRSAAKKGIVIPKVPNTIAGGYEIGGDSYESDFAKYSGYYDVVSRAEIDTVNGISYFRSCPLIGKDIDVKDLQDTCNFIDIACSEFDSILDTCDERGRPKDKDKEFRRGGRLYQSIFMLAYNGCKDICVMPATLPYDITQMTYGQAYTYALGLSHAINLMAGAVDNWYIYIGNIEGKIFAEAMYSELSTNGNAEVV